MPHMPPAYDVTVDWEYGLRPAGAAVAEVAERPGRHDRTRSQVLRHQEGAAAEGAP